MLTSQLSPLGFSLVVLPGSISGPHRLPWPRSWLSLLVVLQFLTHTSPPGGLPWLPTFSLERNLVFPASCVFFSSKHMHVRLFLKSLSNFLSLLLFLAFLDDRIYLLKKSLKVLQNIHASRLRAPWAFVFRLIHGLINIVIDVSPKCQIPFCHYALLFSSCFLGSPHLKSTCQFLNCIQLNCE